MNDAFQALGLMDTALYLKALPGLTEYPPASYDQIAAADATSKGATRGGTGRRMWTDLLPMWYLPRKGLELGVGRRVAWQTPLHREAVRRALEGA